jgi:carbon storage regulator
MESATMLVLSRKLNESILLDGDIRITVVDVRGKHVRLGIEAPDSVRILRQELCEHDSGGGEQPPCVSDDVARERGSNTLPHPNGPPPPD